MKILYLGSIASTDSDFPLLREYQRQGIDVVAYFELAEWNKRAGIIYTDSICLKNEIISADKVSAFQPYKDYIDLSKIFIINAYHNKRSQPQCWILWWKVLKHMQQQNADVIHFIWPLAKVSRLLYFLKCKRVLTVHDPFPHSSSVDKYNEKCRIEAFKKCDRFILLNNGQVDDFCKYYHVNPQKVIVNKMGEFDYLAEIKPSTHVKFKRYILFFGQIQSHKGVDVLLKAMLKVHLCCPDVGLVIAGKGKFTFDISPYENLDYIEFRNYYVTVTELAGLLHDCLFSVCPYKDATQSGVVQTAFSANVPLIVTNVGALPEVVEHDVTGLVIPPSDEETLAESIKALLDDSQKLLDFKNNIERYWKPNMKWDTIAEKYIKMYKDIINEEKRTS